jgi:hypothetical protein
MRVVLQFRTDFQAKTLELIFRGLKISSNVGVGFINPSLQTNVILLASLREITLVCIDIF